MANYRSLKHETYFMYLLNDRSQQEEVSEHELALIEEIIGTLNVTPDDTMALTAELDEAWTKEFEPEEEEEEEEWEDDDDPFF